jgi:signal transduction histidine kinase
VGIEERAALFAGSVRVESAPGSGTSVFVELPLLGEA